MRSDLLNWFIYSTSLGFDRCSKSKRLYVGFFCWQNASNSTKISTFPFFLAADKHAICVVDVNMHWSLWIRSFLGDEGEVPASVIYYHFLSSLFIINCSIFFCYYHHFSDSHISWIVFIFIINCIFPLTATAHLVSFL